MYPSIATLSGGVRGIASLAPTAGASAERRIGPRRLRLLLDSRRTSRHLYRQMTIKFLAGRTLSRRVARPYLTRL